MMNKQYSGLLHYFVRKATDAGALTENWYANAQWQKCKRADSFNAISD